MCFRDSSDPSANAGQKEEQDRAKHIDRAVQQNPEEPVPDNFISERDEARQKGKDQNPAYERRALRLRTLVSGCEAGMP